MGNGLFETPLIVFSLSKLKVELALFRYRFTNKATDADKQVAQKVELGKLNKEEIYEIYEIDSELGGGYELIICAYLYDTDKRCLYRMHLETLGEVKEKLARIDANLKETGYRNTILRVPNCFNDSWGSCTGF